MYRRHMVFRVILLIYARRGCLDRTLQSLKISNFCRAKIVSATVSYDGHGVLAVRKLHLVTGYVFLGHFVF
jgi:hypothetical protein